MISASEAALELEAVCAQWTKAWNLRDWDLTKTAQECLSHIDVRSFKSRLENGKTLTWAETIQHNQTTTMPGHYLNITSIRANVHEHPGRASVLVQGTGENFEGDSLKFHFVFETAWKMNQQGTWLCYEMTSLRGGANHAGFV